MVMLSSPQCLWLLYGQFAWTLSSKTLCAFQFSLYVPHSLFISVSLLWSFKWCMVCSTVHQALDYAVSSAPFSQPPLSLCCSLIMRDKVLHLYEITHFVLFSSYEVHITSFKSHSAVHSKNTWNVGQYMTGNLEIWRGVQFTHYS